MKWNTLVNSLRGVISKNNTDPDILSLHMDSREVQPGGLFFCVRGYTVDGHDYVYEAINNGARAIVSEIKLDINIPYLLVKDVKRTMAHLSTIFYEESSNSMQIIGVTGTNGKTTITHIIEKIMNQSNKKTGIIGTMYTKIGLTKRKTKNTTPESLLLQRTFKEMKDESVETVIMEVSSHALHSGRVRGTDFDIAIFTNLSPDHLDYHKTMEEYKNAKGLLFSQLGNTYQGKVAILNADDAISEEYKKITIADIITYGIENDADVKASNLSFTPHGTTFNLELFGLKYSINTQLIGKFNVYNILASIAACYSSGVSIDVIQDSVSNIKGVDGRFETVKVDAPFTVIVDYAHTPDSLENILLTASEFKKGQIILVVGTGGDRDKTKRPQMAGIATRLADYTILTSDNPRSENPLNILKDMESGVLNKNYTIIVDRKKAIQCAVNRAQKNDIIIIAGKGHETYQIFANQTIDFDDKSVAIENIKNKYKC